MKFSEEGRRNIMKSVKSQSKLENLVSKELWKAGIRFRKNEKSLMGKPDISIKKYKVVIFIDSCFWHFCEVHGHLPQKNSEFWEEKLLRNRKRDQFVNEYYENLGWNIKRIWEHEIKENLDQVIDELLLFINKSKNKSLKSK